MSCSELILGRWKANRSHNSHSTFTTFNTHEYYLSNSSQTTAKSNALGQLKEEVSKKREANPNP